MLRPVACREFEIDPDRSCRRFGMRTQTNLAAWKDEVMDPEELFIALHDHLPAELIYERELLICRL